MRMVPVLHKLSLQVMTTRSGQWWYHWKSYLSNPASVQANVDIKHVWPTSGKVIFDKIEIYQFESNCRIVCLEPITASFPSRPQLNLFSQIKHENQQSNVFYIGCGLKLGKLSNFQLLCSTNTLIFDGETGFFNFLKSLQR